VRVFGIDPGHNFSGVAVVHFYVREGQPVVASVDGAQFAHPIQVRDWIRDRKSWTDDSGDMVVVEDYIGAGHLTKEAKSTLQVLGYFRYSLADSMKIQVHVRKPQQRLSRVREATALMEELDGTLPFRHVKDTIAALAHALSFMYSMYGDE
jgi:hypothetical protein